MPAIITDRFRIHNSEQFKEAFSETSGNTMYLGIQRHGEIIRMGTMFFGRKLTLSSRLKEK